MRHMRWRKTLNLALLVGINAACETGTEPMEGLAFDAEAALADHQAMDIVLASEAMKGFKAMAQGVTFGSFSEEVQFVGRVASELDEVEAGADGEGLARRITRLTAGMNYDAAKNPIISSFRRGKTFAYDPELGRYVIDQDREGAPSTGVRFILYEPGQGGKPDPTKEIGYADLIDEGDNSAQEIALRLKVVEGDTTILDYRTTVDILNDGGKITVEGFLQGEYDRLDFDIQVQGSSSGGDSTMDISFEMGIENRDFLISGTIHGVDGDSGEGGEINLLVRHGGDSFSVEATGDENHIEGTFKLNGDVFAIVSGDPDDPTISGATGGELTWAEFLVLRQILDSTEDVFDLFEDLLDPVDELVILAFIL